MDYPIWVQHGYDSKDEFCADLLCLRTGGIALMSHESGEADARISRPFLASIPPTPSRQSEGAREMGREGKNSRKGGRERDGGAEEG